MPCDNPEHPYHEWPTTGNLTIYSCETFCGFCTGQAGTKRLSEPRSLRNHVESIHTKHYPGLVVDKPYGYAMKYTGPTVAQLFGQMESDIEPCSTPSPTSTISVDNSSSQEGMLISPSSSSTPTSPLTPTSSPSSAATSSTAIKDAVNAHYDADDGVRGWRCHPTMVRQMFHDQIVNLIHFGGYMGMTAREICFIMEQVMIEEFWSVGENETDEDETDGDKTDEDETDEEESEEDEMDEQESEEDAESEM